MSAYLKDIFREIKNSSGRFISLIIIAALGATSLVGIQAAAIDMRNIADKTYKDRNLYDLQLKSTIGFDEDDITALVNIEEVSAVMPTIIIDTFITIEKENRAVRTYALPDEINKIDLLYGRLPVSSDECLVENRLFKDGMFKINDKIHLSLDDMEDYFEIFDTDEFTIVGIVNSPLYISLQRGHTTLGDGSLQYYLYLHPDAYILDIYTDVYLTMNRSIEIDNLTDEYNEIADDWKSLIELTGASQVQIKKDELADAQLEIDDGWIEYYDGLKELEQTVADGWRELNDANEELQNAKIELEDAQNTLDETVADGLAEIDRQHSELRRNQRELNERLAEWEDGQAALNAARAEVERILADLEIMGPQGLSPQLDYYYEQAYAALAQINGKQAELDEAKAELDEAQRKLNRGRRQINEARDTLEEERIKAQDEIDEGWIAYHDGIADYNEGVLTLEKEEADALAELEDARLELVEAQEKLDDIPTPEWFYFTRKDGLDYDSYYQDTHRLERLGYVFPFVFFLVAIMVSLTSMSRMVEDNRTHIGIYKALGYSPAATIFKYLIYAFSASIIGGILGVLIGSNLLPVVIATTYGHLYNFPPIDTPIPVFISMIAVASAVTAVVLMTVLTFIGTMTDSPAVLMRPRPPAKGKRVILERIPVLWKNLGFFSKVTARNIFRYKKRFIMTLAGVAGCSALLITGFGLRDSVRSVADKQFGEIFIYDARIYLKDIETDELRLSLQEDMPGTYLFIREEAVTVRGSSNNPSASIIIPDVSENLPVYINLHSPESGEHVSIESNSVLITEKLSRLTGVFAGEDLTLTNGDGSSFTVNVTGVVDNYLLHYIYMSPDLYKEIQGKNLYPNSALIFYDNDRDFASKLLLNENVRAVIHSSDLLTRLADTVDAMGVVTVVLIVLACALALVVLFNLTGINISERIRELATIKVLGFNNIELAMYIYRENTVVTLLGVCLGIVGGIFLHEYVLSTVEIDVLKFPQIITTNSFIYSIALSMFFAIFVNFAMYYKLARIDMVESLKSVE